MNARIATIVGLLLPAFAVAQTAPSVDQNYCAGSSLNPPISTFVAGLCNAGNSVVAALQNYKTTPGSSDSTSSGSILSRLALGSSKSNSAPTGASPATPTPTVTAPAPVAPAAPPSNNQSTNPYTYS